MLETVTKPVALYERSGLRKVVNAVGATKLLPAQIRDMERMLPNHLPLRGARHQIAGLVPARAERRARTWPTFWAACRES